MSLATRLTLHFLALLAAVLIGFSLILFFGGRWALLYQADAQLLAALRSLVAAIEIEPDGVEWNTSEHRLDALDHVGRPLEWRAMTDDGFVVDETPGFALVGIGVSTVPEGKVESFVSAPNVTWRVVRDRVAVPDDLKGDFGEAPDDGEPEYPALTVTAAVSIAEVNSEIRQLGLLLTIGSLTIWAAAAAAGRWLCRRALRPVGRMAVVAAEMTGHSDRELPVPDTNDEVALLGNAFNGLLIRLHEAYRREQHFTAEASHQLRTPLTALLGNLTLTLRRERTANEYRAALEAALYQSERLRQLLDTLLQLARGTGATPLDRVDLSEWLPEYLNSWNGHAASGRLRLHAERGIAAVTNTDLLGQILDVLIDNAFKHGPSDSEVTVRLQRTGTDQAMIEVADEGAGVPPDESAGLFRPFTRGATAISRGVTGTGLGLALARRLAERLGMTLSYAGGTEGGSRFRLVFPLTESGGAGNLVATGNTQRDAQPSP